MEPRPGEVESVVIDRDFWRGRRVFLTGHTGFKGAWASLVLRSLGAQVFGFALPPYDDRNLFVVADGARDITHHFGDVRDLDAVQAALAEAEPDLVIHMAAQALVRRSYTDPVTTYATNVMGTVHVLEAVRQVPQVRAALIVTSDKCYDNVGRQRPYRETDAFGGHDPYSNSKGCAELVTDAYRRSFFRPVNGARIATARAGNVIGGGDWAPDRLVPDAMQAFMHGRTLRIRNPGAVRPWQHVLDPVIGYLVLAQRLAAEGDRFAEGWNFGPATASEIAVSVVADRLAALWGSNAGWALDGGDHPHEAADLRLDCSKVADRLGWTPLIPFNEGLRLTVEWYKAFRDGADMRAVTSAQIDGVLGPASTSTGSRRTNGSHHPAVAAGRSL